MKIHHVSEAGVSFEIQFGLSIKIWAGEHIFLHMAANYRLNVENLKTCIQNRFKNIHIFTCQKFCISSVQKSM